MTINDRRACLRVESAFWLLIEEICACEEVTLTEFCQQIERENWALQGSSSLTSAISVSLAACFHAAATEQGHAQAGHDPGRPRTASAEKHESRRRSLEVLIAPRSHCDKIRIWASAGCRA